MSSIAIIPARGGSRRIPRKNIRSFCGKPIIHYPIHTAIKSGLFKDVIVSTDDAEIAAVAKAAGAHIPFLRSARNSNDTATTASVLQEVLGELQRRGTECDRFCCIYPTTPLLNLQTLAASERLLDDPEVSSVQPVVRFGFPPQRAVRIKPCGRLEWLHPEHALTRSQDLEPQFHDAGQFYWWKTSQFLSGGLLVGENTRAYEMSELEAQDIDNEADWCAAEYKYRMLQANAV